MDSLIHFFDNHLGETIASLWVLNTVFFIYALFDKLKSGDSDLILIAFFWSWVNFYATGMFIVASDSSNKQSSPASANSLSSFAQQIYKPEQHKSHTEPFLKTYTRQVSLLPLLQHRFLQVEG